MSRTLSVLIVENFVITEGPKWDKFKRGAKKVGAGVATAAAVGSVALASLGGNKIYNAHKDYASDMNTSRKEYVEGLGDLKFNNWLDIRKIDDDDTTTPETKEYTKSKINDNFSRDWRDINDAYSSRDEKITDKRDQDNKEGKTALAVGAGLGVVPLVAGAHALGVKKGKKDKEEQATKSLKERLNLVKSGMFLNEESANITALRNKINQGLILLPGLKGAAADRMEDSIRSWEDQINELEKKIGELNE